MPTVNQLTNENIYFLPCGAFSTTEPTVHHVVRIFTTISYIGQIYIDTLSVSALLYQIIPQTTIYYYEQLVSADMHSVTSNNVNAMFAVSHSRYTLSIDACFYLGCHLFVQL